MFKSSLFIAVFPTLAAFAMVTPSEPAPGTVFKQGDTCNIEWDVDTTGTWTETNIELMTGSNTEMIHLTSKF